MKVKVVIADDQEVIIQGVIMMLDGSPEVEIVGSNLGSSHLAECLRKHHPEVLLLDIQMPHKDGIDLCKEIIREMPEISIIALTNFVELHYVRQMLRSGARGYLLKNTDRETLIKAIVEVHNGKLFLDSQIRETVMGELAHGKNRSGPITHLTKREKEILKLIAEEYSNQQIADKLFISLRTVETHRLNLTQKLSVRNTAGLVKEAIKRGLL